MKIGIASDHNGFELKKNIITILSNKYEIVDCGNTIYDKNDDYPVYAFNLARRVSKKEVNFGLAICGSGIGISIACNKVKNIRCAKVENINEAKYTRIDNDANIVAISSNTSLIDAVNILETFINTPFSNEERHQRRINMIIKYENGEYNEL